MKILRTGLLLIASAGLETLAAAPAAPNYVFVEVDGRALPLAFVKQGRFDMFSVLDSLPELEGKQADERVGLRNAKVYGYRNGQFVGRGNIVGFSPSPDEEGTDAVLIAAAEGRSIEQARIFTTQPLKIAPRALPRQPSASEVTQAQEIVRGILRSRQVPPHVWPRVLKSTRIQPVRIAAQLEILVIRAPASEIGERALDFFLIAEQKGGHYQVAMSRVHWGGLTCKQDFDLFDHADLDADGTDELIYSVYGWEWWRYWIIRRENGRWTTANQLDEQEC